MRRLHTYILVGIFASLVVGGLGSSSTYAASPSLAPLTILAVDTPSPTEGATGASAQNVDTGLKDIDCDGAAGPVVDVDVSAPDIPTPGPLNFVPGVGTLYGMFQGAKSLAGAVDIDTNAGAMVTKYIICPAINASFKGVQLAISLVETSGLLAIRPLLDGGKPSDEMLSVYASWTVFRDLANVALIFALFAVILSQATSYGLSAYGIKKMLPKIVIAAILINLSYVICAILIDIFNILGTSLDDLLHQGIAAAMAANGTSPVDAVSDSIGYGVAFMSMFIVPLGVMFLIVFFLMVLIAICAIFFLIARYALIVVLVIIAPLAFMAWLFPNTESQFRRWWSTFTKLLAIYPIVMVMVVIAEIIVIALSAIT